MLLGLGMCLCKLILIDWFRQLAARMLLALFFCALRLNKVTKRELAENHILILKVEITGGD